MNLRVQKDSHFLIRLLSDLGFQTGSTVYGTPSADTDIDFCVLLMDTFKFCKECGINDIMLDDLERYGDSGTRTWYLTCLDSDTRINIIWCDGEVDYKRWQLATEAMKAIDKLGYIDLADKQTRVILFAELRRLFAKTQIKSNSNELN